MTGAPGQARPRNVLLRAALTAVALVVLAPAALVLAGGFLPDVAAVARLGALLNEGLAWVWLGVIVAMLRSGIAVWLGGRRFTVVLFALAVIAAVGAGTVTWRYAAFASEHGASYDLLRGFASPVPPGSGARVTYATVDGEVLDADIWSPEPTAPGGSSGGRAAIVYVHGGSFIAGGIGMRPALFGALADAGIVVIDVAYRLAPPPRWQDAPADVLCALAWLRTIAAAEGIDPARVVVMGESAGGSLALLAAYTAGTDQLTPSCPGDPIVPAGVIAVAPAADLAGIWQDATLTMLGRRFPEAYVGGSPREFPDRYAAASPFDYMRADLPPTLLLTGENDHLVRLARVNAIADALDAAGADVRLLIAPFADHGFDGPPNSFGAQVEASIVRAFLAEVAG